MTLFTERSAYSPAPAFPRHVVTAVLVSHDGARWLPRTLGALTGQERPVQRVVAVDTGSEDKSPTLLADALGPDAVLRIERDASFGEAVEDALATVPRADAASLPYPIDGPSGGPGGNPHDDDAPRRRELVEWIWLLHDDSEPAPDALLHLLRAADELPSAAVLGPKVRSWYDRRSLLEVGTTIAPSGKRWTGLERREQDQGQHDAVRGVLSVGSPGMLVRRDVWESLGGFDPRLRLSRDDTDFGWRVNAAGHRVVVVPDAVVQHAEAATRERRPIDCGPNHPHRVDRAGATYTLLANSTSRLLPLLWLRLLLGTLLRTIGHLLGKQPRTAADEFLGSMPLLINPLRVLSARRARRRTRTTPDRDFRDLFPARGATARQAVEGFVSGISRRVEPEGNASRHSVLESGPADEDTESMETARFTWLRAAVRRPGVVLVLGLVLVTLVASRDLLTGGQLVGGALLAAPDGASDLWARYLESWHDVGLGGDASAPPYLAVVAAVATVLFGDAGAAVTLLLVGSVPLAGLSAYLSARRLVPNQLVRAWGAAVYALLPVATGAVAAGRLGTAVLLVLAPVLARGFVQTAGLAGFAGTWRSAWATGLVLAVAAAFVPLAWPVVAVAAAAAIARTVVRRHLDRAMTLRLAAVVATPALLLGPWTLDLAGEPSLFLREPGLAMPGLAEHGPSPVGLLLADPGGPGTLPAWVVAGLLLAALAALMRETRRTAVLAAWSAALGGLVLAAVLGRTEVTPDGGLTVAVWPGAATVLIGLGYAAAAVVGADDARDRVAASNFGWRQPAAVALAAVAAVTPVVAAAAWMWQGADGPLRRAAGSGLPAVVAADAQTVDRARAVVLRPDGQGVAYVLVRGGGQFLGDAELAPAGHHHDKLDTYLETLMSGSGGADARGLTTYGVRFVLLQGVDGSPETGELRARLDGIPGLQHVSTRGGTTLWRLQYAVGRAAVVEPDGRSTPVPAGDKGVRATIQPGADGRVLRLAEFADPAWKATIGGRGLKSVTVDGWAQGFELPAGGGTVTVERDHGGRGMWLAVQAALLLVVVVLALPSGRRGHDDDLPETEAAADTGEAPTGRRARREAAAAEAAAKAQGQAAEPAAAPAAEAGSLFVSAPRRPVDEPAPEDDDWDLGRYAQGFRPSESPVPGAGDPGQSAEPFPGQSPQPVPDPAWYPAGGDAAGGHGHAQAPAYDPAYGGGAYGQNHDQNHDQNHAQGYDQGHYDPGHAPAPGYGQPYDPAYDPSGYGTGHPAAQVPGVPGAPGQMYDPAQGPAGAPGTWAPYDPAAAAHPPPSGQPPTWPPAADLPHDDGAWPPAGGRQ